MSKKTRSKLKKKNEIKLPIDILKSQIIIDSMMPPTMLIASIDIPRVISLYLSSNQVLMKLISYDPVDKEIEDINAMIGINTDEIKWIDPTYHNLIIEVLKSNIEKYQKYAQDKNLQSTVNNFESLKSWKLDNSIYQ